MDGRRGAQRMAAGGGGAAPPPGRAPRRGGGGRGRAALPLAGAGTRRWSGLGCPAAGQVPGPLPPRLYSASSRPSSSASSFALSIAGPGGAAPSRPRLGGLLRGDAPGAPLSRAALAVRGGRAGRREGGSPRAEAGWGVGSCPALRLPPPPGAVGRGCWRRPAELRRSAPSGEEPRSGWRRRPRGSPCVRGGRQLRLAAGTPSPRQRWPPDGPGRAGLGFGWAGAGGAVRPRVFSPRSGRQPLS